MTSYFVTSNRWNYSLSVSLHVNPTVRVTKCIKVRRLLLETLQMAVLWGGVWSGGSKWIISTRSSGLCPLTHAMFAIVVATSSHGLITDCQIQRYLCSSREHNPSDVLTAPHKKLPFTVHQFRLTECFEIMFYAHLDIFNCVNKST
jgi:hypothetical protein